MGSGELECFQKGFVHILDIGSKYTSMLRVENASDSHILCRLLHILFKIPSTLDYSLDVYSDCRFLCFTVVVFFTLRSGIIFI